MSLLIAEQNTLGNGGGIPQDFGGSISVLPFSPTFSDEGLTSENLLDLKASQIPDGNKDSFAAAIAAPFNFLASLFNTGNAIADPNSGNIQIPTIIETSEPNRFGIKIDRSIGQLSISKEDRDLALKKLQQEGKVKVNVDAPSTFSFLPGAIVEQAPKTLSGIVEGAGDLVQGATKFASNTVTDLLAGNVLLIAAIVGGVYLFLKVQAK